MEKRNLLFVHIPKTAGTSFKSYLDCLYYDEELFPEVVHLEYGALEQLDIVRRYKCFYGHCIYDVHRLLPQPIDIVTFLRNPVDRVISTFEHVERNEEHGGHKILHQEAGTISEFVCHSAFHVDVANLQTRVLGMSLSEEERQEILSEDVTIEKKKELWDRFRTMEVTEETLSTAKDRLSSMYHFGITEAFDYSLAMFARKKETQIGGTDVREACAPQTQTVKRRNRYTHRDVDLLKDINKYDIELYDYARRLFDERYEEMRKAEGTGERLPVLLPRLSEDALGDKFETEAGWRGFKDSKQGVAVFKILLEASNRCSNDTVVLDVSAGQCRYKSFFEHAQYVAIDSAIGNPTWDYSKLSLIGDAHHLPVRKQVVDVCANFTSLEHYKEPDLAFREMTRVLKPGGWLFLYVPFAIAEHEPPYDFFRYTRYALAEFCTKNGLEIRFIRPTNGLFQTTLNMIEFSMSLLDPNLRSRFEDVVNRSLKPLFSQLDDMEGVTQDYPKDCPMPQMPAAYCLCAKKPGKHVPSEVHVAKNDLLKEIAACPKCTERLEWGPEWLRCNSCKKVFPLKSGIPYLMPE